MSKPIVYPPRADYWRTPLFGERPDFAALMRSVMERISVARAHLADH